MLFGQDPNKKDQMDPEDLRNLFIFFVVASILYFTYDALILKPQAEAIKQSRQAETLVEQSETALVAQDMAVTVQPREDILTQQPRLEIQNKRVHGSMRLVGGRIDDIELLDYYQTLKKEKNVSILSPKGAEAPRYIEYGWIASKSDAVLPTADSVWKIKGEAKKLTPDTPVTLVWENGQGLVFERILSLDENFLITVKQRVHNTSEQAVTLYPFGLVSQNGKHSETRSVWFMHEGPIGWIGEELVELKYNKLRKEPKQGFQGDRGWIGVTEKYWFTSLIPPQNTGVKYSYTYSGTPKDENNTGQYQVDFVGPAVQVAPGRTAESVSHMFTGAKEVLTLKEYGNALNVPNFDLAVDFGWLWFLSKPFFYGLHFLGKLFGNMGVAIILLTIAIRSATFPLTNTSYRSFAKMKKVGPEISALRKKHGENRAELQKALVALYEREGVNPMAGCFPILLQIPIFFALYKTLFVTLEIRHAPFFGWIQDLSAPDPTSLFNLFGLIPWDPPAVLHIGVWPCLMLLILIVQKKLNPPPQDQLQRDMATYFPFLMTYILSRFASGLVVYWTFSALIGVIQQMIIMRASGVPIYILGQYPEEEELEKQVKEGPDVHPLVEMAEEDVEEALFGHDEDSGETQPKKVSPPKKKKSPKKKK